ncbi:MAG: sulfite exporter TauE/SafE family protein [Thalassotalea sp.]
MSIDLFSAFVIGILGSGHCLGMCGGITTMLTSSLHPNVNAKQKHWFILLYHFGRILSYSFIGFLVALTSSLATKNIGLPVQYLKTLAAVFLIFIGLYLGQWLMWLTYLEKIGKLIWPKISPFSKKLIPVNNKAQAFLLGTLWGWLPCGLVYSTLTWALASNNPLNGALIMLAFGLGTLPALVALSYSINWFKSLLTNPLFRKLSAISLIIFGIYNLATIWA